MLIKCFLAFGAGFISFLTPCVLPIIPGYISYITGKKLEEMELNRRLILTKTIIFSLGFSSVFVSLGIAASFIGNVLLFFSNELRIFAGLIIIFFSLQLLGILNLNFLNKERKIETKSFKDNYIFPYVVGAAFAFGWTPCIGPILGSILILASTTESIYKGILLLSSYSLGLAIPFIFAGYATQKFLLISKNIKQKMNIITKTGGVLLLITGVLILTNKLQVLGFYILEYVPILSKIG